MTNVGVILLSLGDVHPLQDALILFSMARTVGHMQLHPMPDTTLQQWK